MSPLILVRGLRYQYDDGTVALNGVDFRLEQGETVALLGANGSGKTTFALHLNGLLSGEGTVEVCGLPVNPKNIVEVRRKIGLVFQDSESQLFMPTVLEDVAFGPLNHGLNPKKAAERAMAALEQVGMSAAAGKAPYHLSAGEKKRVAIACPGRADDVSGSAGTAGISPVIIRPAAGQGPDYTRYAFCASDVLPRGILQEWCNCGGRIGGTDGTAL
jgi:ABC-type multidrug transport system ATPase subunit